MILFFPFRRSPRTAVPPSSRAGLNRGPHPYQGCALPTELRERRSGRRDSNPRPSAWKADALPTELHPHVSRGGYQRGRGAVCSSHHLTSSPLLDHCPAAPLSICPAFMVGVGFEPT